MLVLTCRNSHCKMQKVLRNETMAFPMKIQHNLTDKPPRFYRVFLTQTVDFALKSKFLVLSDSTSFERTAWSSVENGVLWVEFRFNNGAWQVVEGDGVPLLIKVLFKWVATVLILGGQSSLHRQAASLLNTRLAHLQIAGRLFNAERLPHEC